MPVYDIEGNLLVSGDLATNIEVRLTGSQVALDAEYLDFVGQGVDVVQSGSGVQIQISGQATQTWIDYVSEWSVEPFITGSTVDGDVWVYSQGLTTRFRFVPNAYDSTQDAFYTTWNGTVVSGLIVSRG